MGMGRICRVWGKDNLETITESKDFPCTGQSNSYPSKILGQRARVSGLCSLGLAPAGVQGTFPMGPLWLPHGTDTAWEMSLVSFSHFSLFKTTPDWSQVKCLNQVSSPTDGAAGPSPCTSLRTLGRPGSSRLSMPGCNVPSVFRR